MPNTKEQSNEGLFPCKILSVAFGGARCKCEKPLLLTCAHAKHRIGGIIGGVVQRQTLLRTMTERELSSAADQIRGPRDILNLKRRASSESSLPVSPWTDTSATPLKKRNPRGSSNNRRYMWLRKWKLSSASDPNQVALLLQKNILEDCSNSSRICSLPPGVSVELWLYEHLRRMLREMNELVVSLRGLCDAETCPQMKATDEWQYLCAAHASPKECCAVDYIIHTLDGATALLTSTAIFESRYNISQEAAKNFQPIARRLYRVFSHTFYHHREAFNEFEVRHSHRLLLC
mmetsp:Transcript_7697/g.19973  ORF Transcript_7697/g.19973 Transcript_7697/m.19973 type:complete len:290 (+) Transcript_7697:62-931(+)